MATGNRKVSHSHREIKEVESSGSHTMAGRSELLGETREVQS